MKILRTISPLLTLIVLAGGLLLIFKGEERARAAELEGRVTWVSDGDTIRVDGHPYPIRLWGIDAPERDTQAGQQSRDFLSDKILKQNVFCRRKAVDQYRRTVAECQLDEQNISEMMIKAGQAVEYCRFTRNAFGTC